MNRKNPEHQPGASRAFESYNHLEGYLRHLPITFYPALIKVMAEESLKKGVWKRGGLSTFIERIEDKFWKLREGE